jgi:hypothetical protein
MIAAKRNSTPIGGTYALEVVPSDGVQSNAAAAAAAAVRA